MLQFTGKKLMASKAFQFLNLFPIPTSRDYIQEISANNLIIWRCFSGGRGGGSRWNLDANVNLNQRPRLSDAYLTEDYDDEGEFWLKNAAKKKRVWWSDDFNGENDDDDEEEEMDVGFGVQEASISFKWIFKVLRSFGWMIPAVITSLVLGTGIGTGTDSIFMALALPIAQSVFSLITETLWKRTKLKSKKRTAARASRTRKTKGTTTTTRIRPQKRAGDYTSWVASSNVIEKRNPRDFGGWDELDNQAKGR